jgi:hypothetical protein
MDHPKKSGHGIFILVMAVKNDVILKLFPEIPHHPNPNMIHYLFTTTLFFYKPCPGFSRPIYFYFYPPPERIKCTICPLGKNIKLSSLIHS